MQNDAILLPWFVRDQGTHTIKPAFGAFVAAPDEPREDPPSGPEEPPPGLSPLTFWVEGHPVASTWLTPGTVKNLRSSTLLATPVDLVLIATLPLRFPGWVRVDAAAVPVQTQQFWSLLELHYGKRERAPVGHVGWGRLGLHLGHHWDRLPEELRRIDRDSAESRGSLVPHFERLFERILFGPYDQAAARLLESIPGIRGERPDPVC